MNKIYSMSLLIVVLSACSSGDNDATGKSAIPQSQLNALDKAGRVEDSIMYSEQQRREEMEEQGL